MPKSYNVDFGRPRGAKCRFRMLFGRVWKNMKNYEFLKLEKFGQKLKKLENWSSEGFRRAYPGGMCGAALGLELYKASLVVWHARAPQSGGGGLIAYAHSAGPGF